MAQAFETATQSQTVAEGAINSLPQPIVGAATTLPGITKNAATIQPPTSELIPANVPIIVREKTFFEKPASTIVLVAMVAIVVVVVVVFLTSSKPLNGPLISSLGAAISYIGAWYAGRQQNKK